MVSTKIGKDFTDKYNALPRGWVFYILRAEGRSLYAGFSGNLGTKLRGVYQKAEDDALFGEMMERADTLEYESFPNAFEALVRYKVFLVHESPEYQFRIHWWSDYVYLAIDPLRFPFVSIQSHTNDDWQYLGPFRSRFFLVDVMDSISRILKLPFCETGNFPCEKFDKGVCRGWCLSLSTAEESDNAKELDRLEPLLQEAYLHPNNGILEMISKEREKYFNDLEFAKADLLDDEINLLSKYRDWLNFLYLAKELTIENKGLSIQQGQLAMVEYNGHKYHFKTDIPEYRANEALEIGRAHV